MKILVTLFGWVPVLGVSLKVSYLSKKAYDAINKVKVSEDQAHKDAKELEGILGEFADQAYVDFIEPEVQNAGVPDFVAGKVKNKAVGIILNGLKKKYLKQTT
jgi:hypothetical protein